MDKTNFPEQWTRGRTITGMRLTQHGSVTLRKDLMLLKEDWNESMQSGTIPFNWNTLVLRCHGKLPLARACISLNQTLWSEKHAITGESNYPVPYKALLVLARTQEQADEVVKMLGNTAMHKGDDLFKLACDMGVIIKPVTQNDWLFYDGFIKQRHERAEFNDVFNPGMVQQAAMIAEQFSHMNGAFA